MDYNFLQNLQNFARLAGIFQPSAGNAGQVSIGDPNQVSAAQNQSLDASNNPATNSPAPNSGFAPQLEMYNRLASSLDQMPVRPDLSKTQRVLAGLSSLAAGTSAQGIVGGQPIGFKFDPTKANEAGNEFLFNDYYNKLADWKTKTDTLSKAANEERQANAMGINAEKLKISQQRADAYSWKQTHPNEKLYEDERGLMYFLDPTDGSAHYVTDSEGEPIKSSALPEAEKIKRNFGNAEQLVKDRESSAEKLAGVKEVNTQKDIAARTSGAIRTKQTPSGTASAAKSPVNKPETPSARARRIVNQAMAYREANPNIASHIHINGTDVSIDSPGMFTRGYAQKDHDTAYQTIFGDGSTTGGNTLTRPDGHVYDISTWTPEQVSAAKANGYK